MTVSSTTRKAGPFSGNGSVSAFPFAFKVFTSADVAVTRANASGIESVLVLNSDYTVALNSDQSANPGGTVTLSSALATGFALAITGNTSFSQGTQLPTGGAFNAANVESALDRATILSQQVLEQVDRAVKVPVTSSTDPDALLADLAVDVASAASSAASALASLNTFKGQYYGPLAADPTLDPLGNAPTPGDLYFSTASTAMRTYNGVTWQDVAQGTSFPYQVLSGNGSTTAFTLASAPGTLGSIEAFVGGVRQTPGVNYVWSGGTTLTFTAAPPAGTGNVFVRWVSTQPVSVPSDASVTVAKLANSGAELGMRNRIINGAFRIAQRGTSSNAGGYCSLDRWGLNGVTAICTLSQQTATVNGVSANTMRYAGVAGNAAGNIQHKIESSNCYDLVGKNVTVSFWVYQNTGSSYSFQTGLNYANSVDNFSGTTGITSNTTSIPNATWTFVSFTTSPLPANAANGLMLQFFNNSPALTANTFEFAFVQLEQGPTATPFEFRPYGAELALCQRYARFLGSENGRWQVNTTTFSAGISSLSAVPMRAAPTASLLGSPSIHEYGIAFRTISAVAISATGGTAGYVTLTTAAATLANSGNLNNADSSNGILLSAEL